MKISVIVPIYNVEAYLRKCLDSLVNQSFDDFEIVCVNDGSPDNSQAIVDEYKQKYSNIVSIIQENKGLGGARNTGIEKARGKYLMFVDSDDYLELNSLEVLYKAIEKEKADIVCFNFIREDVDGNNQEKSSYPLKMSVATNKLYRKEAIGVRFIEKVSFEDINFTRKMYHSNLKIVAVDDALYHYIQRVGSIVYSGNPNKSLDAIIGMSDLIKWLKEHHEYDDEEMLQQMFNEMLLARCSYVLSCNHKDSLKVYHKLISFCHQNMQGYRKKSFYQHIDSKTKIITLLYWYNLGFIFKLYHAIKYH